jgi:hypothetical protein
MSVLTSFWILMSFTPVLGFFREHGADPESLSDDFKKRKQVLLLGASVGKSWKLPLLPQRIDNSDYAFEYQMCAQFDKSECLKDILSSEENKPDVVFLKECAAYFPGDMESYKKLMMRWITECLDSDVIPIPATVVPVTRLHSVKKIFIDLLRGRKPFRQGNPFKYLRNKAILEYNDWLRLYCKEKGLNVLDLEASLRYSENNRFLREDLARIDGLHLNGKAYELLDRIVLPVLEDAIRKS